MILSRKTQDSIGWFDSKLHLSRCLMQSAEMQG